MAVPYKPRWVTNTLRFDVEMGPQTKVPWDDPIFVRVRCVWSDGGGPEWCVGKALRWTRTPPAGLVEFTGVQLWEQYSGWFAAEDIQRDD